MNVQQVYTLVNNATQESIGESAVVEQDLSNIVDIGTAVFNANAEDNYVKSLVNQIGKIVFVDRAYSGSVPSVLMDAWEFGSVLEKISTEMPDATENKSWELTDGQTYDQDVFKKPNVSTKFFNDRVTFEIQNSITEKQVKESFQNATQLNSFISMLFSWVDKSMTVKLNRLIMSTINSMIARTIFDDYSDSISSSDTYLGAKSGTKAINLLYLYNEKYSKTLAAEDCCTDTEFIKFATYIINLYVTRLNDMSVIFNIDGKERFTPKDKMHIVLLNEFNSGAKSYLQADTFNKELARLPEAETVSCWQGTGTDFAFSSTSAIDVKIKTDSSTGTTKIVTTSGILGVIFDHEALGVSNLDRRMTTHHNARAEFYNNWFKMDAGYFNDTAENCIVFFVADKRPDPDPSV